MKIAGGGMAVIYLGKIPAIPGRRDERLAALKVVRHDLRHDERFVNMFLDEAKVLSRLSHPNIAAIYEFGVGGDHEPYIAMELLVGRTLLDVWEACKAKKLTLRLDHAAWIAARVADALHSAHEAVDEDAHSLNVVHRDVNPSNVFLTFEGAVKLFDFGLAKARGRRGKSVDGIVKGKLPYLSPEQVAQLPIDRRSDIYMLGTTLWEMTTMRRLFKRDDDVETLMLVKAGLVPDPRATVPKYPEALWDIVRRALARDRDDRYPTAAELARDLDAFVATLPADDMQQLTAAVLDALFPGEREAREQWIRRAHAPRPEGGRATLPPPVHVVGAPPPSSARPPPPSSRPAHPGSYSRGRKA